MADLHDIIGRLTPAQRSVLQLHFDRPRVHSGRGGFSKSTMEALTRLGLAKRGRQSTHELHWCLTELGMEVGRELSAQTRARSQAQERVGEARRRLQLARTRETDADARCMATSLDDRDLPAHRKEAIDGGHAVAEAEEELRQAEADLAALT